MRQAGIREARQHLSGLLEEVRNGGEVVLTDRGRPVARLLPPQAPAGKPFRSHAAFRASIKPHRASLAKTIIEDREDRI